MQTIKVKVGGKEFAAPMPEDSEFVYIKDGEWYYDDGGELHHIPAVFELNNRLGRHIAKIVCRVLECHFRDLARELWGDGNDTLDDDCEPTPKYLAWEKVYKAVEVWREIRKELEAGG